MLEEEGTQQNFPSSMPTTRPCSSAIPNRGGAIREPPTGQTLAEAIRAERELLEPISMLGHRIDTSGLKANACAMDSPVHRRRTGTRA